MHTILSFMTTKTHTCICFRHLLLMSTSMLKNLIYFMVARPQNVWIHRTSKIRWHALYGILGTVT